MTQQREFGAASGRIVCFGEVMAELADTAAERVAIGVGGDTFNTAVYLARSGFAVSYATALGCDPFSRRIRSRMLAEGIDDGLVLQSPDRACGLYAIEVDDRGERHFTYWRSQSAARAFFALEGSERVIAAMEGAGVLYLSGITLSLFPAVQQRRIADIAATVRAQGGQVVFDTELPARRLGLAGGGTRDDHGTQAPCIRRLADLRG